MVAGFDDGLGGVIASIDRFRGRWTKGAVLCVNQSGSCFERLCSLLEGCEFRYVLEEAGRGVEPPAPSWRGRR